MDVGMDQEVEPNLSASESTAGMLENEGDVLVQGASRPPTAEEISEYVSNIRALIENAPKSIVDQNARRSRFRFPSWPVERETELFKDTPKYSVLGEYPVLSQRADGLKNGSLSTGLEDREESSAINNLSDDGTLSGGEKENFCVDSGFAFALDEQSASRTVTTGPAPEAAEMDFAVIGGEHIDEKWMMDPNLGVEDDAIEMYDGWRGELAVLVSETWQRLVGDDDASLPNDTKVVMLEKLEDTLLELLDNIFVLRGYTGGLEAVPKSRSAGNWETVLTASSLMDIPGEVVERSKNSMNQFFEKFHVSDFRKMNYQKAKRDRERNRSPDKVREEKRLRDVKMKERMEKRRQDIVLKEVGTARESEAPISAVEASGAAEGTGMYAPLPGPSQTFAPLPGTAAVPSLVYAPHLVSLQSQKVGQPAPSIVTRPFSATAPHGHESVNDPLNMDIQGVLHHHPQVFGSFPHGDLSLLQGQLAQHYHMQQSQHAQAAAAAPSSALVERDGRDVELFSGATREVDAIRGATSLQQHFPQPDRREAGRPFPLGYVTIPIPLQVPIPGGVHAIHTVHQSGTAAPPFVDERHVQTSSLAALAAMSAGGSRPDEQLRQVQPHPQPQHMRKGHETRARRQMLKTSADVEERVAVRVSEPLEKRQRVEPPPASSSAVRSGVINEPSQRFGEEVDVPESFHLPNEVSSQLVEEAEQNLWLDSG